VSDGMFTVIENRNISPKLYSGSVIRKKKKPIIQNRKKKINCSLYCFSLRWIAIKEFKIFISQDKTRKYKKDLNGLIMGFLEKNYIYPILTELKKKRIILYCYPN
jgi:hypothetical protein